jgi:hypothetical protein
VQNEVERLDGMLATGEAVPASRTELAPRCSLLLAAVLAVVAFNAGVAAAGPPDPVQIENARRGSMGWEGPIARGTAVEGYASSVSATPGQPLAFHVSTRPAARYRVELYRLGWYDGAGARLVVCSPSCTGDTEGFAQPVPAPSSADPHAPPVRADWPVTDTIPTEAQWASGYYLARFVLTSGPQAGAAGETFVILRQPPRQRQSLVLVQVPVNTWEAYNEWGGVSLYDFAHPRSYRVSFDRPYGYRAQSPLWWEIQLVRFLEREGYDVSYQTDLDTSRSPESLSRHQLVMTAGHDEYWTSAMRDGFDRALAAGTNLAFMGSNAGYWHVEYQDGGRTIFGYKSLSDPNPIPAQKTALFREIGRPECEIEGVMHNGLPSPPVLPDYTVTDAAAVDPWFRGTGLRPGDTVRDVVGQEWDRVTPFPQSCFHPGLVVLLHYAGSPSADAARFTARSGARVFASGAQRFSWGLDSWGAPDLPRNAPADPRLQRFARNMLDDLTRPAAPQVTASIANGKLTVSASAADLVVRIVAYAKSGGRYREVCSGYDRCLGDSRHAHVYAVVAVDSWGRRSTPMYLKR